MQEHEFFLARSSFWKLVIEDKLEEKQRRVQEWLHWGPRLGIGMAVIVQAGHIGFPKN
jgi:hypothetical protein